MTRAELLKVGKKAEEFFNRDFALKVVKQIESGDEDVENLARKKFLEN